MKEEDPASIDRFLRLLETIALRPGVYVGLPSLSAVGHYLNGYVQGADPGQNQVSDLWGDFTVWIQGKFLCCEPEIHWTQTVINNSASEEEALSKLPTMFDEYLRQRDETPDVRAWVDSRVLVNLDPDREIYP